MYDIEKLIDKLYLIVCIKIQNNNKEVTLPIGHLSMIRTF